jgi:hypothetical protein
VRGIGCIGEIGYKVSPIDKGKDDKILELFLLRSFPKPIHAFKTALLSQTELQSRRDAILIEFKTR